MMPTGRDACLLCQHTIWAHPISRRRFTTIARCAPFGSALVRSRHFTPPAAIGALSRRTATSSIREQISKRKKKPPQQQNAKSDAWFEDFVLQTRYPKISWHELQELGRQVLGSKDAVPSEQTVLAAMNGCAAMARQRRDHKEAGVPDEESPVSASSLLSLDSRSRSANPEGPSASQVSQMAYDILKFPTVFINPDILRAYIKTQTLLEKPDSFPEAFYLYAHKPVPKPNVSPPEYKAPKPNNIRAAIPIDIANLALSAAIRDKDLELCLDVIKTSFRTKAFWNNRIFTRIVPPVVIAAALPLMAWTIATKVVNISPDPAAAATPESLKLAIFGGSLTYFSVVWSMGMIVLSTSNDQMERVTWRLGTPLRERWMREEERAAMDRVVCAWGFSERRRRGEEEGEEWDYLKEWIGSRGCIVDKVELMDGMQ